MRCGLNVLRLCTAFRARHISELPIGMLTARSASASSETSAVSAAFTGAIGTVISASPAAT